MQPIKPRTAIRRTCNGLISEQAENDGGNRQQHKLTADKMIAVNANTLSHRRAGGKDHQGAKQNDQQ